MMHIMKIILYLGLCYGLRGGEEITKLMVSNLKVGIFPDGHPLKGKFYVKINPENTKTCKLSIYHTVSYQGNKYETSCAAMC